ncbi:hypothetical protein OLX02_05070 [Novosphingobium sp. KCTC 2891]|nr:hypothetical protein [Novosphingobium sp. KCTC 2891]
MLLALGAAAPSSAREVTTRSWVDERGVRWTETTETWVEDGAGNDEGPQADAPAGGGSDRLLPASFEAPHAEAAIARFGPFAVLDGTRAALVRETDTSAPRHFLRMLRAYPGIRVLELADCPGTVDDNANLALGRMIHARGIATDVPPGGSVRSGAVDLFLAGVRRTASADAAFAVHAWLDEDGLRPTDFGENSAVNRNYVAYYHEMGMPLPTARAFYALTNSVPNEQALWLHTGDIARYAALDARP